MATPTLSEPFSEFSHSAADAHTCYICVERASRPTKILPFIGDAKQNVCPPARNPLEQTSSTPPRPPNEARLTKCSPRPGTQSSRSPRHPEPQEIQFPYLQPEFAVMYAERADAFHRQAAMKVRPRGSSPSHDASPRPPPDTDSPGPALPNAAEHGGRQLRNARLRQASQLATSLDGGKRPSLWDAWAARSSVAGDGCGGSASLDMQHWKRIRQRFHELSRSTLLEGGVPLVLGEEGATSAAELGELEHARAQEHASGHEHASAQEGLSRRSAVLERKAERKAERQRQRGSSSEKLSAHKSMDKSAQNKSSAVERAKAMMGHQDASLKAHWPVVWDPRARPRTQSWGGLGYR